MDSTCPHYCLQAIVSQFLGNVKIVACIFGSIILAFYTMQFHRLLQLQEQLESLIMDGIFL